MFITVALIVISASIITAWIAMSGKAKDSIDKTVTQDAPASGTSAGRRHSILILVKDILSEKPLKGAHVHIYRRRWKLLPDGKSVLAGVDELDSLGINGLSDEHGQFFSDFSVADNDILLVRIDASGYQSLSDTFVKFQGLGLKTNLEMELSPSVLTTEQQELVRARRELQRQNLEQSKDN
jgi:hypothetical protein